MNRYESVRDVPFAVRSLWAAVLLVVAYLLAAVGAWGIRTPAAVAFWLLPGVVVLTATWLLLVGLTQRWWTSLAPAVAIHVVLGVIALMTLPAFGDPVSNVAEAFGLLLFAMVWPTFVLLQFACDLPLYPSIGW